MTLTCFSRYKEVEHEEIEYEKPTKIIDSVMKKEEEIAKELKELRVMLK
jgi:hypothetical protein